MGSRWKGLESRPIHNDLDFQQRVGYIHGSLELLGESLVRGYAHVSHAIH
jgi:hypothetical protein